LNAIATRKTLDCNNGSATGHNSPSDDARELFKPFKVEKSLVLCNQKTVSVLDLGFFVYVYMMAGCLSIFCLHYDDVINPWEATK